MAKTRGQVGSRRSKRNQGLEVVDQEDKAPQLKVKKRTAKKTASPKKNLVLTPTRRSSRIKKVAAEDDYIEDVTPPKDDEVEDVTPPKDDEVQDVTPAHDDEVEDDQAEKSMSEEDKDDEEDVNGKEDEEDGDVNGKENEEDGDLNGKENEEEPANMEDDGVLNEKGNEEEACEEEAHDMEEDGTAQDDEIPSTEGVELAGEEVSKKNKRGPTKLRRVAENPNDKIMVTFNDIGEHVGPGSVTLSSFLGPLVREHVPVTLDDWRKLDAATKATMLEEIQVCIYISMFCLTAR
ncbi:protein bfr2-like [Brassica napus]|uniref:protein bfr2-like n=1 Tax=Brassica napus TaxID=3708 RepID=UPI0020785A4E|nr:protein bfr2-like [Brassica napus]